MTTPWTRRAGLLAIALVLCTPGIPGVHAASAVQAVVLDRIEAVDPTGFAFTLPCGDTGAFVPVDNGFRFEERQTQTGAVGGTPYPGGYLSLGCGEATLQRTAPDGARSVEARFWGDRGVAVFNAQGTAVARPGRQFDQELHFQAGLTDRRVAYIDPGAGALPLGPLAPDGFPVPGGVGDFRLTWSFRDSSYFVGPDFPDVLSGQDFSATVQDITLRYPDLPLEHKVDTSRERQGSLLVESTRVRVTLDDPAAADLRLQLAPGIRFEAVRGPDGSRITAQTSRLSAGPDGFDRSAVLVESLDQGRLQVTVPSQMLAALGPGAYELTFTGVDAIATNAWLLPVAIVALLAPLPFAALAYHHVRRYEDEAFGGFRRSARNLRVVLLVAFAYYVAVLAGHFAGSRLDLLTAWPLPVEALLLYVQVGIAIATFLALFAVAQELYRMTVPRDLPEAAPPSPEDLE